MWQRRYIDICRQQWRAGGLRYGWVERDGCRKPQLKGQPAARVAITATAHQPQAPRAAERHQRHVSTHSCSQTRACAL